MNKVSVTARKAKGVIEATMPLGAMFNEELANQLIQTLSTEQATKLVTKFNGIPIQVIPTSSAQDILDQYQIGCFDSSMTFKASKSYLSEQTANLKKQVQLQGKLNNLFAEIESLSSGREWLQWFYNVYLIIRECPLSPILNAYKVKYHLHIVHDENQNVLALLNRMKAFCKSDMFEAGLDSMAEDLKNYLNTPKFQ
ncbi:hypothetical protein [Yersinia ruckeri]|uniref:hypothetical protein n=1 Tax=Yersinia ruckeri TaxID=29486 RepID=UPI002237C4B3|nr:hypothetical protein [Yersinia ruckeri]MCW6598768.1 hypothetical protein [Yersinia ruckeri]